MTDFSKDRRGYIIGAVVSLLLTVIAFTAALSGIARTTALAVVAVAAVVQIVTQVRFFLHIDLSQQKREDLHLILFSLLLLAIMAGGTMWILSDLSGRMG